MTAATHPLTMDELAIELSASAPELFELPAEHYIVLTGRSAEALLCVYKGADRESSRALQTSGMSDRTLTSSALRRLFRLAMSFPLSKRLTSGLTKPSLVLELNYANLYTPH